jgi:diacylglycerol O-acyltransferase / wax synthase
MSAELLTPVDANWFRMERGKTPADILSVMLLEGAIDEKRLREVIERKLLPRPRFRRRVVESRLAVLPPHWEDEPDFRLDDHLIRMKLDAPGDEPALSRLLQRIANEPLDFSRSPWRIWAIDGVLGGSAIVTRLHHCLGDGFALLSVLLSLADAPPAPGAVPHPVEPSSWPAQALHLLRTVEEDAVALAHLLFMPFDPATALRGKLSGRRCVAWTRPLPLGRVRDGAHARGATVNDALMSSIAGALRQYLLGRGATPPRVRGIVPVNLRPPSEPVDEEHGNYFGLVFVELALDVADREARVVAVKREMDRIKASKEAVVSLAIMNVLGRAPAAVDHVADELFARKGSLVITNVPGPREPLAIAGRRIKDIFFWAPHPGLGLGVSIMSYAGNLRLGVRTDAAIEPEPDKLVALLESEIEAWTTA